MRKLSAILVLGVYLLVQVVSIGWYCCKPLSHAWFSLLQEIKFNSGGTNDLLILTVDKSSIAELENEESEIVIDGMLYDIEKIVSKAGKLEVYLEKDEGENKWAAHYSKVNQILHKQSNGKTGTAVKAAGVFMPLFYTKQFSLDMAFNKLPCTQYHLPKEEKHTAPDKGKAGPPPKIG